MKKLLSLIRASMTEGMNIFRINTKKKSFNTKVILPIVLALVLMLAMYSYNEMVMSALAPANLHFVLLTIFIFLTSILTLIEGIYKSGNLLFNCKDDNLLLSLPVRRSTVLFIRVFKFYVFELMYNSIFLLPSIFVYAKYVHPSVSYYVVSAIGLLIFPILPILLSCIAGTIITFISSKFKKQNIAQTIVTMALLLGVFYFSFNLQNLIAGLAEKANSINDFLTKLYYPAGAYINLVLNFNIIKLIEFIVIHIILFVVVVLLIGRIYFGVNSSSKSIKVSKSTGTYKIKSSSVSMSFIKKEFGRFINSTVFITNAGFGLVLFVFGCIISVIKFNSIIGSFTEIDPSISAEAVMKYVPIILFGFISFTSFMTSITSSMISLEGRSFNILKSLPVKPYKIVRSKVLMAILVMIPCILIGDIIIFVKYKFDLLNIVLILAASIILPLLSETIGIIFNLKYPRMDAQNDTEVVKQGMSSSLSIFTGMLLIGLTCFYIYKAISWNLSCNLILLIGIGIYGLVYLVLQLLLYKMCDKWFDNIVV